MPFQLVSISEGIIFSLSHILADFFVSTSAWQKKNELPWMILMKESQQGATLKLKCSIRRSINNGLLIFANGEMSLRLLLFFFGFRKHKGNEERKLFHTNSNCVAKGKDFFCQFLALRRRHLTPGEFWNACSFRHLSALSDAQANKFRVYL